MFSDVRTLVAVYKYSDGLTEKNYIRRINDEYVLDIEYEQDAELFEQQMDYIEMRRNSSDGYTQDREHVCYGSIPSILKKTWETQYGLTPGFWDTPEGLIFINKKLDDPDFKKLRVNTGRIGRANGL